MNEGNLSMTDAASIQSVKEPTPGYNDLKFYFSNLNTMFSIRNTLATDMMTVMAPGGMKRRLHDISAITKRIYAETTTPTITGMLDRVENEAEKSPDNWSEWDKANLVEMRRIHSHFSALPPDVYIASVQVSNEGRKIHAQALEKGDWDSAVPYVQKVVDLYRKIAELKQKKFKTATPYRALLLGYASDISTRQIDDLYDNLLDPLQMLYGQAKNHQSKGASPLSIAGNFSRRDQMALNKIVLDAMGFDFQRGRVQVSNLSPMTAGNPDDVRILVRCKEGSDFSASLFDSLYQGARGLYYQNLPADWITQPVGQDQGAIMLNALSRLYATAIAPTEEFSEFIAKAVRDTFNPTDSVSTSAGNLYDRHRQINHTAVRNEADEFTKIFHDIIRYRIERDVINDNLQVKDIPERWNAELKDLLGIEPKSSQEGPLQNPDWFTGRFGFIPTNTLSHIMAVEFYQHLNHELPDLSGNLKSGDLKSIGQWAQKNIHASGHLHGPFATTESILGRELNSQSLVEYFKGYYLS